MGRAFSQHWHHIHHSVRFGTQAVCFCLNFCLGDARTYANPADVRVAVVLVVPVVLVLGLVLVLVLVLVAAAAVVAACEERETRQAWPHHLYLCNLGTNHSRKPIFHICISRTLHNCTITRGSESDGADSGDGTAVVQSPTPCDV